MALSCTPIEVIMEWPSGSTATPSASTGPDVICSGFPSEYRWRHKWLWPSTNAVKYMHEPSGDQPADLHGPSGPMAFASKPPSSEIRRQRVQRPISFISITSADL